MSIFLTVILCILSFVVAFLGVAQGIVLIVKMITFTQPFSTEMVKNNVYQLPVHKQLIFVDWTASLITLLVASGMAAGIIIWGKTPCLIVAIVGLVIGLTYSLVINKAAIGRTQYNIDRFVSKHSICMNEDEWNAYINSVV